MEEILEIGNNTQVLVQTITNLNNETIHYRVSFVHKFNDSLGINVHSCLLRLYIDEYKNIRNKVLLIQDRITDINQYNVSLKYYL